MPHLSWNDFFNVFGLRRASFEANITNLNGNKGAIDLLWNQDEAVYFFFIE